MVRVREKKLLALLLIVALVIAQSTMFTTAVELAPAAVPGVATVRFTYLPDVDPDELTVKVSTGALAWSSNDAAHMAAASPVKTVNGVYIIDQPGWFTLYSKGDGYYSVQTYFKVTAEDVAAGKDMEILIENNKTAGANNHDPSNTFLRLPPISERQGAGNWTDDSKANTNDYFFALGSDTAPYTGPDYFQTPAFGPDRPFYQFSTQEEMEEFIAELEASCDDMYVYSMGKTASAYENDIPIVVFTKADLSGVESLKEAGAIVQQTGKPTYWHGANIHGNEQSSGEGALAIMYDLAGDYGQDVLDYVDVVVVPRINPDGHQNHIRATLATNIDPNRDHLAFKSMEVYYLHKAYMYFLPELAMDGHELGSWSYSVNTTDPDASVYNNGDDMQSTPATSLNNDADVTDLAIKFSLQQQEDAIESGIRMMHYTSTGTTKNNAIGRAYYGLMNSVSVLVETRGQVGGMFKRRTYTQYMTSRSLLNSAVENAEELIQTVAEARAKVIEMGKTYDESNRVIVQQNNSGKDTRLGAIQRYNLRFDGSYALGSVAEVDYAYTVARDRSRPTAYIVPKSDETWVNMLTYILDGQGIEYYEIKSGAEIPLEQYYVTSATSVAPSSTSYRAALRDESMVSFPNGAIAIPMDQVTGNVIAMLMEPDVSDSAGYDGCLTQTLYAQSPSINLRDSATSNLPIYRYTKDNPRTTLELENKLHVATDAHLVKKGDYFRVNSYFDFAENSNAAVLNYTFDTSKYEYRGFTPAEGVTVLDAVTTADGVKLTVMIENYKAKDFGEVLFSAKEDVDLENEYNEIALKLDYVIRNDETGEKAIYTAEANTSFTSYANKPGTGVDGDVTLIDLSNIIDVFGIDRSHALWTSTYQFQDYNNNGEIDIYDICYVAKLVK